MSIFSFDRDSPFYITDSKRRNSAEFLLKLPVTNYDYYKPTLSDSCQEKLELRIMLPSTGKLTLCFLFLNAEFLSPIT